VHPDKQGCKHRAAVNNGAERIAFFSRCRFPSKAQPPFSITRRVILPLLLAEGRRITSFLEDGCIATMINTHVQEREQKFPDPRAR
jgi:hypothetical protein